MFCLFLAPASYNEYQNIKQQLEVETVPGMNPGDPPRPFHSLPPQEQAKMSKKRLAGLCKNNFIAILCLMLLYVALSKTVFLYCALLHCIVL